MDKLERLGLQTLCQEWRTKARKIRLELSSEVPAGALILSTEQKFERQGMAKGLEEAARQLSDILSE